MEKDVLLEKNIEIVEEVNDLIDQVNKLVVDIEKSNLDAIFSTMESIETYVKSSYDKVNEFILRFQKINQAIYVCDLKYYEENEILLRNISFWLWGFESINVSTSFQYGLMQLRKKYASNLKVSETIIIYNNKINPQGIKLANEFETTDGYAVYCIDFISVQLNKLYHLRHNLGNRYNAIAYICNLLSENQSGD